MNTALILAGGTGRRMGLDQPKQYLMLRDRPVIDYSLRVFQQHERIDSIVIVADLKWRDFLNQWLLRSDIDKFAGYAQPGETRQFSVFNGLKQIELLAPDTENVIIHDAARPILPLRLITTCLEGLTEADGVMPALPMKDTCYQSGDGQHITGFLPRSQLFAGQAPEAFRFRAYLEAHERMPEEMMRQISGSSEMAYKSRLKVRLVEGSERNIKLTTKEDLLLAEQYLNGEGTHESLCFKSGRTSML